MIKSRLLFYFSFLLLTLTLSSPLMAINYLSEDCFTNNYKLTIYKPNATLAEYQLTYLKTGQSINFSQKNYLKNNVSESADLKVKILHEAQVTSKEKGMICSFLTESWRSKLNIKIVGLSKKYSDFLETNKDDSLQFSCKSTLLTPVANDYNRQMMRVCEIAPYSSEIDFSEIVEE